MQDSNVPSPEVQSFIDSVDQTKAIASLTKIIEQRIQEQLESHLLDFEKSIAQSNAIAVDLMLEELSKLKAEDATVKGVLTKLSKAIAPDIPPQEEVVSFRQAIDNLEKYGSIIPSQGDIALKQLQLQHDRNWSLFWQSFGIFTITQLHSFGKFMITRLGRK